MTRNGVTHFIVWSACAPDNFENTAINDFGTGQSLHSVENQVNDQIVAEKLKLMINNLKAEQREVVVLRYIDGYSISETAIITGRTEDSIKSACKRALIKLKEQRIRKLKSQKMDELEKLENMLRDDLKNAGNPKPANPAFEMNLKKRLVNQYQDILSEQEEREYAQVQDQLVRSVNTAQSTRKSGFLLGRIGLFSFVFALFCVFSLS